MKQHPAFASFDQLKAESFIRAESTLAVVSNAAFDDVAARLVGSIAANGMVILHVHDFGHLLGSESVAPDLRCRVYEVCNVGLAAQLIALDAGLAHVLPCRIAMHDRGGMTSVITPRPSVLMAEFSHAADVARLARTFEAGLQRVLHGLQ
ncbi:MAG: DUF302 domain-containing protein [Burkholderiaceae bacterium]